jgi:hypothetical protein
MMYATACHALGNVMASDEMRAGTRGECEGRLACSQAAGNQLLSATAWPPTHDQLLSAVISIMFDPPIASFSVQACR